MNSTVHSPHPTATREMQEG